MRKKPLVNGVVWYKSINLWIGIAIALIVIPSLIGAIVWHETTDWPDAELDVVTLSEGPNKGEEVSLFPQKEAPWEVIANGDIDLGTVRWATNEWNKAVGFKVFQDPWMYMEFFSNKFVLEATNPTKAKHYMFSTVSIKSQTEAGGEHCGGVTRVSYDVSTGGAYWATITINPMFMDHERTYKAAVLHELGHALLLGHADPHHDSSIMRKKLDTSGKITDHLVKVVRSAWTSKRPARL